MGTMPAWEPYARYEFEDLVIPSWMTKTVASATSVQCTTTSSGGTGSYSLNINGGGGYGQVAFTSTNSVAATMRLTLRMLGTGNFYIQVNTNTGTPAAYASSTPYGGGSWTTFDAALPAGTNSIALEVDGTSSSYMEISQIEFFDNNYVPLLPDHWGPHSIVDFEDGVLPSWITDYNSQAGQAPNLHIGPTSAGGTGTKSLLLTPTGGSLEADFTINCTNPSTLVLTRSYSGGNPTVIVNGSYVSQDTSNTPSGWGTQSIPLVTGTNAIRLLVGGGSPVFYEISQMEITDSTYSPPPPLLPSNWAPDSVISFEDGNLPSYITTQSPTSTSNVTVGATTAGGTGTKSLFLKCAGGYGVAKFDVNAPSGGVVILTLRVTVAGNGGAFFWVGKNGTQVANTTHGADVAWTTMSVPLDVGLNHMWLEMDGATADQVAEISQIEVKTVTAVTAAGTLRLRSHLSGSATTVIPQGAVTSTGTMRLGAHLSSVTEVPWVAAWAASYTWDFENNVVPANTRISAQDAGSHFVYTTSGAGGYGANNTGSYCLLLGSHVQDYNTWYEFDVMGASDGTTTVNMLPAGFLYGAGDVQVLVDGAVNTTASSAVRSAALSGTYSNVSLPLAAGKHTVRIQLQGDPGWGNPAQLAFDSISVTGSTARGYVPGYNPTKPPSVLNLTGTLKLKSHLSSATITPAFSPDATLTFEDGLIPTFMAHTGQVTTDSTATWGTGYVGAKAVTLTVNDPPAVIGNPGATSGTVGTATIDFSDGLVPADWGTSGADHVKVVSFTGHPELGTLTNSPTNILELEGARLNSTTRYFQRTYTWASAGTLDFDWVDQSEANYDFFTVTVDGTSVIHQSGAAGTWQHFSQAMTQGTHTLRFEYSKDSSAYQGDDAAFIANLVLGNVYTDHVATASTPRSVSSLELRVSSTGDAIVDAALSWNLQNDGVGRILLDGVVQESVTGTSATGFQYNSHQVTVPAGVHTVRWEVTSGNSGGQSVIAIDLIHVSGTTPTGFNPGWLGRIGNAVAAGTLRLAAALRGHVSNSEQAAPVNTVTGTVRLTAQLEGTTEVYVPVGLLVVTGTLGMALELFSGFFVEIDDLAPDMPDGEDDPNASDVVEN